MIARRWLVLIAIAALAALIVAGCQPAADNGDENGEEQEEGGANPGPLIEAWAESTHAVPVASIATRAPCAGCHDGLAFSRDVEDPAELADRQPFGPYVVATDCRACHTGQGAEIFQAGQTEIPSQTEPVEGGKGALCMACHNQEIAPDITDEEHPYPHYGPQAEVLKGIGGILDGLTVASTQRHAEIEDTCVTCHMADDEGAGHTFRPTEDECADCHEDFESADAMQAGGDYDGDGSEEAFVDEVQGLMDAVQQATNAAAGSDEFRTSRGDIFFISDETTMTAGISQEAYQGAFNWVLIDHDKSRGIHNPYFTVTLLQETYRAVSGSALPGAVAPEVESE